ncbi:conserved hypothetical protein [Leishmania major strain Friedlin]|uniref:Uncharacterized protein n=1 Tax=Leishmania major TaxID=5664 RepID=Q4QEH7_LEIMA|nr:conserved hypothetical protein [Leishmania major strain Friedlin]CAG9572242.1 hypothetical_protein_-_conserved [Leishmania major strain Friedlin]CAJ03442.1 conserved hypothetical protein [Leishmania major strain Friedlin]|eukprot:XP_001682271.1 conserved hypothetical protein [Leishmania major strain Friedlin]
MMSGSAENGSDGSRRASSGMTGSGSGNGGSSRGSDDDGDRTGARRRGSSQRVLLPDGGSHGHATSTHTNPRSREPSLTVAGRSSSLPDTPLKRGSAAAASGVKSFSRPAAARFVAAGNTPPLSAESATPVAAAAHDVRDTVEYRAAWDLELWKAVQADRFRKELEKQRSVAFADLERLVKRREREARVALQQRTTAVALREEAVQAVETRLAEQQQHVSDMEKDVRRMRQQLLDAQQRVEDEVRAQVRLANDTIAHRARLLEERVKAAEAQARRADERQRLAQQEYLSLYEAFSRYRTQQLASPGSASGGTTATAMGGPASSSFSVEQLRTQWETEHQLQLDRQAQRHASDMAAAQQRCRELEEQNRRLTAALARRREQLRRHAESASPPPLPTSVSQRPPSHAGREDREGPSGSGTAASSSSTPSSNVGAATTALLQPAHKETLRDVVERTSRELHRLETERSSLVEGSSGALRETDTVIVRIDARIRELREHLSAVASWRDAGWRDRVDGTERRERARLETGPL